MLIPVATRTVMGTMMITVIRMIIHTGTVMVIRTTILMGMAIHMITGMTMTTDSALLSTPGLLRLLQLSSVSLPVGGFAFSQGLEYAVEKGWVSNMKMTREWIATQLHETQALIDLPVLKGAMLAVQQNDEARWWEWNDLILASRETRELRLTDTAMGEALVRLLKSLDVALPQYALNAEGDVSFVALYAWPAVQWQIPYESAATGLSWAWLENMVAAATKLVPLGQTQAQQLLSDLQTLIPQTIEISHDVEEDEIGGSLPAMAIASAKHETQYTRLFRS